MAKSKVIMQIGGEGGDLTIYGVRKGKGWLFSLEVIDQSLLLMDEQTIQYTSDTKNSWEGALELIQRYKWHRLYPLEVHPDFRKIVYEEVLQRFKSENEENPRRLPNWKEVCGMPRD